VAILVPAPFLDDEGLTKPFRKPLTHQARDDVGAAGGRESNDPMHRPRRIGLRPRDPRHHRERGSARGQMQKISAGKFHFKSSLKAVTLP
jgi:hypothetical protein